MKLRKIFATAAMALCVAGASAQVSMEDVRIYINPGHGSWGPNNRHMATIGHNPISSENPDTTDFYESNTNLYKGLAMLEKLVEYGVPFDRTKNQTNENPNRVGAALDLTQNIVMSRVKSGPYPYETVNGVNPDQDNDFNRTLSTIAAEVEANNFDMFVSIHSNAASEGNTTNYLAVFYRTNRGADETECINMSVAAWNQRIQDRHTLWSHYDYQMTAEDVAAGRGKIVTGNYAVISHSVSGYLVEGYFHTYQPSRHRYMNFDMCRLEGVDYARGVADYFGWAKESTGDIVGVVRDKHEKFSHELYNPKAGSYDVYKPLNGVNVTLMKGETEVATYTTDVNYNGLFAFRDLEPGDYTVKFAHEDYKADSVWTTDKAVEEVVTAIPVTVKAATTTYPTAFIESKNYVVPTTVYVNYPDSTAGKEKYSLKASYKMYDDGTCTAMAETLAGKTVRRTILRDGKMYVLALDAENKANVYIFDITKDKLVKTLAATAAVGDILPLSDIALTAEGVLVGINKCNQAFASSAGAGNVTAYKWENGEDKLPEGEAQVWWTNNFAGNFNNGIAGESMVYVGTLEDGKFIYTATTTGAGGNTRLVLAEISAGEYIGYMRNNQDGTYIKTGYYGETYNITLSPNADDMIIFDSEQVLPFEIQLNPADTQVPTILGHMAEGTVAAASNNASYFKYAGKSVMVATDVNAEGKVAGLKMFDITEGIANATEITTTAKFAEPVEAVYAAAHGELDLTFNEITGVTTDAEINVCVVVDGKVVKFTETAPPAEKVSLTRSEITGTANPFAYGLSSEIVENTLKVNYSLNVAATAVKVVVKNSADVEVAAVDGAVEAGAHTAEISLEGLADDNYTWEVAVTGDAKATVARFSTVSFYHPAGLDVDNSFESPSFGTLAVAEGYTDGQKEGYVSAQADGTEGGGLYLFNPAGESIKNANGGVRFYPEGYTVSKSLNGNTNGSDFCKVAFSEDGRIFAARYNDLGNYIVTAPSVAELVETGKFTSLVEGMTMTDTKVYNDADGNFLLGPVQSFDVRGAGEETTILAMSRASNEIAAVASLNRVMEYEIGEEDVLPAGTAHAVLDQTYTISYDKSAHAVYDNRGGIWYCQYRSEPTDDVPALVYIDAEGTVQYFEGAGGKVRRRASVSVSPDGTQLVAASAQGHFSVYDIEYDATGAVSLVEKYDITHNMGNNLYSLAWGVAGNLYAGNASGELVDGYSIPRADNTFATKAASKYAFTIGEGPSSIEDVEAVDAPVEYYNLQGVKVANPSNGIFIKKQGNKATKVIL